MAGKQQRLTSVVNYGIIHRRLSCLQYTVQSPQGSSASLLLRRGSQSLQSRRKLFKVPASVMLARLRNKMLTKFVLHGHNDLHLVQTVQAQVFHEVGGHLHLHQRESGS